MKNLRTYVMCVCMTSCSLVSFAQNKPVPINEPDLSKPRLFSNLPEKIQVNIADLDRLFGSQQGRPAPVNLSLGINAQLEGTVTSISSVTDDLQTVIVRSTNYNGANLTVSRRQLPDGSFSYTGRIVSFKHGDLYELQQQQGTWMLVKKNYYDLVNE
jgi:hypothetical protein